MKITVSVYEIEKEEDTHTHTDLSGKAVIVNFSQELLFVSYSI